MQNLLTRQELRLIKRMKPITYSNNIKRHYKTIYEKELKRYETPNLVNVNELFLIDNRLRRRYGLTPRKNINNIYYFINKYKIDTFITPVFKIRLYDVIHFEQVACNVYYTHP